MSIIACLMPVSAWLKNFAKDYAVDILSIDVNIDLTEMLDTCWRLFAKYFSKAETGIKQAMIDKYWPA